MNAPIQKRSPIKDEPLRLPGEGLDIRLRDLALEDAVDYLLPPALLWAMAFGALVQAFEAHVVWWRWIIAAALLATIWCTAGFVRLVKLAKRLKLGRQGERHVGQLLQTLDLPGTRVFHDIPADGFNLDHVLVCDRGIYVIETKTWSKSGNAHIDVKAGRILMRGRPVRGNPVGQAAGAARWLQKMLKAETGLIYECRGVVAIPGWYINPMDDETKALAWVLEPKALLKWIPREPAALKPEDVRLIDAAIARYVRRTLIPASDQRQSPEC